jgi:outer membrane protein TolC
MSARLWGVHLARMKLPLTLFLGVFLCIAFLATAHGAEHQAISLSVTDAIAIALKNNRRVLISQQQYESAASGIGEARAEFLPRLDVIEAFNYTDRPTLVFSDLLDQESFKQRNFAVGALNHPTPLTNLASQIRLEQSLYSGGRLSANLERARASEAAAEAQQTRTKQQVTMSVVNAYFRVRLAEANLQVIEKALQSARSHMERSRNLVEQGQAVQSDFLRTQVFAGDIEREKIEAESAETVERSRFMYQLGIEPGGFTLTDPVTEDAEPLADLDDLQSMARRLRPDLRATEKDVEKSRAAVAAAQAEFYPSLGLVTEYESNTRKFTSSGENFAVFLNARWNLFNGFATSEKVTGQRAQQRQAQLIHDDLIHVVALEVEQAYLGLLAARKQIEVANGNVAQAEESLRILRDRYAAGLARNVDVLDSETALKRAQQDLLKARASSRILRAQLNLATGQMQ